MNFLDNKRGDIWISAVIYIGLGVVAITLLLGAGLPLINKMRDRNTYLQTKEVMQTIDKAIFEVVSEGPGSRRFLSPVEIKKGHLNIGSNEIIWEMETKALLQEPGTEISEGNLKLKFKESDLIKEVYVSEIALEHYVGNNIILYVKGSPDGVINNLDGRFGLSISNDGIDEPLRLTKVNIVTA